MHGLGLSSFSLDDAVSHKAQAYQGQPIGVALVGARVTMGLFLWLAWGHISRLPHDDVLTVLRGHA